MPMASDATMNSGVSFELRNAFARRPASPRLLVHGWTPLRPRCACRRSRGRRARRPVFRRRDAGENFNEVAVRCAQRQIAELRDALAVENVGAVQRAALDRPPSGERGSPGRVPLANSAAPYMPARNCAGRGQIDLDEEAVARGIGRGNDLRDRACQWLRRRHRRRHWIFMPLRTAGDDRLIDRGLQLQRRRRGRLAAAARRARPWCRDRPCAR